jgi:hypothetical protein
LQGEHQVLPKVDDGLIVVTWTIVISNNMLQWIVHLDGFILIF